MRSVCGFHSQKAGGESRMLFTRNSSRQPLLKNLCPVSDLCMHSPTPLPTHRPCTVPPSNMRETQEHGHAEVKLHLLLAWMPQGEDWLSCPGNTPCLSPLPVTRTLGQAAKLLCLHAHAAKTSTTHRQRLIQPCKTAPSQDLGPQLVLSPCSLFLPLPIHWWVWMEAETKE